MLYSSLRDAIKTYYDTVSTVMTNKTLTTPTIASFVNATHNHQNAAGGGTLTTAALDNDAVTNAKLANMAQNTIKGRITASTGDPEDLTAANVRTIINVADGADVTGTAITALTTKTTPVDADAVVITDSAAAGVPKRTTWANIKATLKTYFDTLYGLLATANTWTQQNQFNPANTTGVGLGVTRNLTATSTDSPVVSILQDHASDDQAALRIGQDGTGNILEIQTGGATFISVPQFDSTNGIARMDFRDSDIIDISPGSITTAQTWTLTFTCVAGNRNGGIVELFLTGFGSANGTSTLRMVYKASIAFYRNVTGDTSGVIVNEHINNIVGITLTGPTAIADGFTYTIVPTVGTINRVGALIVMTGTGAGNTIVTSAVA
jgi:hypothetical protein